MLGLQQESAIQEGAATWGRTSRARGEEGAKAVGSVRQKGASKKGAATMRTWDSVEQRPLASTYTPIGRGGKKARIVQNYYTNLRSTCP